MLPRGPIMGRRAEQAVLPAITVAIQINPAVNARQ